MKNAIIILSLLFAQQGFSWAVIGPSSATPVFGPAAPTQTFSDIDALDVKLAYNKETEKRIQEKAASLDSLDGKLACTYDEETVKLLNLTTGIDKLENVADSVVMLDEPNLAKSVGDGIESQSVAMTYMSEMFGTSILSSNEHDIAIKRNAYFKKCDNLKNFTEDQGELQLYNYSCLIYQMLIHMDNLANDSDALYQKTVSLEAALNQAIAESASREAKVGNAEKKINENAEALKKILDKIKEIQKKIDAIKVRLAAAQEKLTAAAAIPCSEDEEGNQDCSARDAAVAAAQAEVDKINKELAKEEKELEKQVEKLVELLVEKFGAELKGVLALLSGTIKGVAGTNDVSFKVNGESFTLLDSGMQIDDPKYKEYITDHFGNYMLNNPNGTRAEFDSLQTQSGTNTFFSYLSKHMDQNDKGLPYYDIWGNKTEAPSFPATGLASQNVDLKHILGEFAAMGDSGLDNITTLGLAVSDYSKEQAAKSQANQLQSMMTPENRKNYISGKISESNAMNENVRTMMVQNICYIDNVLSLYKALYKETVIETKSQKIDPFLKYLYDYSTSSFSKKVKEGYLSEVSTAELLKEYERNMEASTGLLVK